MSTLSVTDGIARQVDYWRVVYRRTWKGSIFSSFLSPLFYVLAMGVLLGGFVKADPRQLEGATSYLAFVVPGLIAAQAMMTAFGETSYPVMGGIKWHKSFFAQIATPLAPRDVVNAMLGFALARIATTCGVYFLVMAPFGVFATWWGPLLAFAGTCLLGLAFAAPMFALSARARSETVFATVYRLGLLPLFLFSGAFFPVTNLGGVGAALARLTPLWQGVNLTRMLCLDHVDWLLALVNVAVLAAITAVSWWLAIRGLERRLVQ